MHNNRYSELDPAAAALVDRLVNNLASWPGHDVTMTHTRVNGADVMTVRIADCYEL